MLASEVLLQLPKPTIVAVTPPTVPVNVGEAIGASKLRAVCVAEDTGLLASEVLLQLPSETSVAVKTTSPVLPATLETAPPPPVEG